MSTLLGKNLQDERDQLQADPIIGHMAVRLTRVPLTDLQHDDGTPRMDFMMAAGSEYRARGGKLARSIGGPAEALLAILKLGS